MKLYHFTDEKGVEGIKRQGFVGYEGRSSFYAAWPSDLAPQGSTDCTWVVIGDVPSTMVEPHPVNPGVYEVPDEILSDYRQGFRYEPVSPKQRRKWGFHGPRS